ncbi:LuxR family transcriptional regulator [Vibrio sp. 99-8-1]|uniref:LuxR family transcriptional regulator n=1 Tax=Vibrio sp. 99-8-1 TaxID=2607602 RepID=UPI001493303B|nr:LuxR family transcriptional regulator [Vibrio sp. 99-8-1]NOI68517.1 LuxR family transcriptional regulator [Vibrio sp. 99-8-1]
MNIERIYQLIVQCKLAVNDAPSLSLLKSHLDEVTQQLGYHYYLFGLSTPKNMNHSENCILSNYPIEWRKRYDENHYVNIDPIILHCIKNTSPIRWSKLHYSLNNQEQISLMIEASDYGLKSGFSVPIHGAHGEKGVLSFASQSALESDEIIQQMAVATLLAVHLYDMFKQSVQVSKEKPSPLLSHLKSYDLSEKEKSCLTWVADGKSSWEIAQILACSERTVNFHLQNAREKLNTFTRTQTVSQALLTGQITPRFDDNPKSY